MKKAAVFSRGIRAIPDLSSFFPEYAIAKPQRGADECVLGWGLRPTANKAREYAQKHQIPYIALEDGFLRSLGLGVNGYPPFALVWDDVGIYYDTSRPSRLENLILASEGSLKTEDLTAAEQAMQQIVAHHLSKYNHAPDFSGCVPEREIVLLIDQTFGDMAVKHGGADETTFATLFQAACDENPDAEIWIKTHPDVLSGKKRGYFDTHLASERVRVLTDDVNPISLLAHVSKVYCATSQLGFEALLCGKQVVVFGRAWYAGWGLTDDRHADMAALREQGRRAPRSLMQLFAAAYLQYSRYINPNTGLSGCLNDVIHYLIQARAFNERVRGDVYCVGMSLWKRAVVKPFFAVPACRLHFVKSISKLQPENMAANARLLLWGAGKQAALDWAQQHQIGVLRMEDGFVRSVGLGSNLVPPLSLVVDDVGIYFDARTPSRLEQILQHQTFSPQDCEMAQHLQQALTQANISKYNVGAATFRLPETAVGKRVLLVPGQVEDDASIRFGSPQINKNADLLRLVREKNPDAFVIYKPHPDVVSGNRVGTVPDDVATKWADYVAVDADISGCLNVADEVHTMTSLTGFEALLRGKTVYCYGLPFYAGWGLTHDELPLARRTRRLSLPELISGTLVHYPQYVNHARGRRIDAAAAIELLRQQKAMAGGQGAVKRSWLAKQIGKAQQLWRSLTM
ncbi:capsular polysaccharide biosynthesis protein [Wielerella bovis]|uniref:capsular polysaccharide biosynthesis protein n=1 Tax=Wielerella bovis TaxID=2917790 RepID=UPI002018968D|nr:capsular polysaccharide biosynthesis protein [Wielerella bovis]ULJ62544.1 capsular polysaccharide biosynthesis protein [Wielerella bovis]